MRKQLIAAAGLLCLLSACGQTQAGLEDRNHILIAGSSTVYPFTLAVAQRFHRRNPQTPQPVVQSTGTGPGFTLFCAGTGGNHPDIVNASRPMRAAEMADCRAHGVNNVSQIQIGIDGLAFVQSPAAPPIRLTRRQVYEALAATPYGEPNTHQSWRDIDPSLPDIPILVYGPPRGDGTRDALVELIMIPGCESNAEMARLKTRNAPLFNQTCSAIRADGPYVESGEDDQRTATALIVNPGAIGIFGYGYLERHGERLKGIAVDGVAPDADTIASGRYVGARPLFIYVKVDQADRIQGLRGFLTEYAGAIGPGGYLAQIGLIPAPDPVRAQTAQLARTLAPLNPRALH